MQRVTSKRQNKEWQKFQDSMTFVEPDQSVDGGFVGKRKVRGGRIVRKQKEKKQLREQALSLSSKPVTDVSTFCHILGDSFSP